MRAYIKIGSKKIKTRKNLGQKCLLVPSGFSLHQMLKHWSRNLYKFDKFSKTADNKILSNPSNRSRNGPKRWKTIKISSISIKFDQNRSKIIAKSWYIHSFCRDNFPTLKAILYQFDLKALKFSIQLLSQKIPPTAKVRIWAAFAKFSRFYLPKIKLILIHFQILCS